jgi:hypothetical protein
MENRQMAIAPYYNTDYMTAPRVLGQFNVQDGAWFEYSARPTGDRAGAWIKDFPHRVFTCDGDRAAHIMKTVAYVVIDELADGSPVVEKWALRRARTY